MATANAFDLLVDDDNEEPTQLVAAQQPKMAPAKNALSPAQATTVTAQLAKPASLQSKPLPPAQAVKEGKNETGRAGGRGGGRGFGRGRGGGGFNRDSFNNENVPGNNDEFLGRYRAPENGDAGKPSERGGYGGPRSSHRGRRGGFHNGEAADGDRPRRIYERRSGTGHGNETKRDGAGHGNWGSPTDEVAPEAEESVTQNEKTVGSEKQLGEEEAMDNKENPVNEPEEKPEDKEMTLEEYEKVLEEKRKALMSLKTEERKVDVKKEFGSMQQLSNKKGNDDIFIKLGSEKDKRKDTADKEERAKKSVSITEFLKPAEGERYYSSGGRGRGRGRGSRGGYGGSYTGNFAAPSIEDPGQFPTLSAK